MDSIIIESEIINIKSDIFLKNDGSENNFWDLQSGEKIFPFEKCSLAVTCKYFCERAFSNVKSVKSEHRATLSDDHLVQCFRLGVGDYSPDDDQLANYT